MSIRKSHEKTEIKAEESNSPNVSRKTHRMPILVRMIFFGIISAAMAWGLVAVFSRDYRMDRAVETGGEMARNACRMVNSYLTRGIFDFEDLEPSENGEETYVDYLQKEIIPEICKGLGLKYLYLFTIDDNNVRHHVVSVASDPEDQKLLDENAPPGSISATPLTESEIAAKNGDKSGVLTVEDNQYGHVCKCVMPYYNLEGELVVFIGADCGMDEILEVMKKEDIYLLLFEFLVLAIGFNVLLVLIRFRVLKPIRTLSERMTLFSKKKEIDLPKREHQFRDEVTDMQDSFHAMADEIMDYIDNIKKLTYEQAQSKIQLQIASKIQSGMVPPRKTFEGEGCRIAASMQPAQEVGGDFYDIFELADGRVGFIIGDVSGKGVGAALFMSMTRQILREHLFRGERPSDAFTASNVDICKENPEGFFATVFAAVWDPSERTLTYANAGHNPPIRLGERKEYLTIEGGIMLGLFDDAEFTDESLVLEKGDGLFLYTDGATEAVDPEHNAYGKERLLQTVSDTKPDPETLIDTVSGAVTEFEGSAGAFDDLTLIAFIAE